MSVIYEPRGRAAEYSGLACNLYTGCSLGCRYCYVPRTLRTTSVAFRHAAPRPHILEDLAREAPKYSGDPRRLLLCFACDPYQPIEAEHQITRRALEILEANNVRATILTKNPGLALRDLDLLKRANTWFGVSLSWLTDSLRIPWEPNAPSVGERIHGLRSAHQAGLFTWISLEPVIDPAEALGVIGETHSYVRHYKVGKINHMPAIEAGVDWPIFRAEVSILLRSLHADYYIKADLRDAR